jgi:NitT/TauT family transport system substrate-binding protein
MATANRTSLSFLLRKTKNAPVPPRLRGESSPLALLTRRTLLAASTSLVATRRLAAAAPVRLGTLEFGTVQWVADVIRFHHLDSANGFTLKANILADTGAGRVALLAGADDVIVSDWMFAAAQRANGNKLSFAPFSGSVGGIITPPSSTLSRFADLKGRKIGVAGGPVDKSWLLVQAACRASTGIDLRHAAQIVYGAPPLLSAKLQQRQLDAVLTFWNFAAELQAAGCREMISVADCARALGLPAQLNLVGFVFRQDWADANRQAVVGFLKAVAVAQQTLAHSPTEWQRVRPLTNAPNDTVFTLLKNRFIAGIPTTSPAQETQTAERVFAILMKTGGTQATAGLTSLPDGLFWSQPA